jgi:hypothetical protein
LETMQMRWGARHRGGGATNEPSASVEGVRNRARPSRRAGQLSPSPALERPAAANSLKTLRLGDTRSPE